jgi:hypothetical protein
MPEEAKARGHTLSLPQEAPAGTRKLYTGFLELLAVKWLHTPQAPTAFSWRFAAAPLRCRLPAPWATAARPSPPPWLPSGLPRRGMACLAAPA